MARQPKLILRESAVEDMLKDWPTGSFLETGAGTGYMTRKFLSRGYTGACYEPGHEARQRLRDNLANFAGQIDVLESLEELGTRNFDYLHTFEVLEHVENDLETLTEWTRYLKPGGKIILSVPAHQKKYGKSDSVVGHLRRYERSQLRQLLEDAGYTGIEIINYGFPISEITRPIANLLVKSSDSKVAASMQERSMSSSHSRQPGIGKIINFVGEKPILPFQAMQRMFYRYDWADGIIATAIKS